MKLFLLAFIIVTSMIMCQETKQNSLLQTIDKNIHFSAEQFKLMDAKLAGNGNIFPRSTDKNGSLITCDASWWTTGFFPGALCILSNEMKDESLKILAEKYLTNLAPLQFSIDNHDIGWIINSSFGNYYQLSRKKEYEDIIVQTAKSLITRFNPTVNSVRSWDESGWSEENNWNFPVNIDNMMNLELLMNAYKFSKDSLFYKIAIQHADKTLKNHFRADNSSFHLVDYDSRTGEVRKKQTVQGFSDESSWARGQAWGLYGFTMMYRETGKESYLKQAKNIAEFIINHPRLPSDKIPYWDFDSPDIPNTFKDASAGAIICSALIELSQYVEEDLSLKYLLTAKQQIESLSSSNYRAETGENSCFILKHSVGALPGNSEVDVALIYADYYYIEAMARFKKLISKDGEIIKKLDM